MKMARHHRRNFLSVRRHNQKFRFGLLYATFELDYLLLDNIDFGRIQRLFLVELIEQLLQHFDVDGHD